MRCGYCHLEFREETCGTSCQGCTFRVGCRSVRCPRCGYHMPEPSPWLEQLGNWASALRRGWRKSAPPPPIAGAVPSLASMRPRQRGEIAYLREDDPVRMRKLMALGLLPGSRIELLRRFPSFILRMGFSRFALDQDIAEAIFVRLEAGENACVPRPMTLPMNWPMARPGLPTLPDTRSTNQA